MVHHQVQALYHILGPRMEQMYNIMGKNHQNGSIISIPGTNSYCTFITIIEYELATEVNENTFYEVSLVHDDEDEED